MLVTERLKTQPSRSSRLRGTVGCVKKSLQYWTLKGMSTECDGSPGRQNWPQSDKSRKGRVTQGEGTVFIKASR